MAFRPGSSHQTVAQQGADDRRTGGGGAVEVGRRSQAEHIAGRTDIYTVSHGTDTAEEVHLQTFVGCAQKSLG